MTAWSAKKVSWFTPVVVVLVAWEQAGAQARDFEIERHKRTDRAIVIRNTKAASTVRIARNAPVQPLAAADAPRAREWRWPSCRVFWEMRTAG